MIGFELLRAGLAWLLIVGVLAFALGWMALARSRGELALFVAERNLPRFLPGLARTRARLRVVLGALALLFLALAALGPVRGYTYRAVSRKGLDLVLCLDTSRSMLAQDVRPSRLERAKREITGLLDQLQGDRAALVAFSGDARDIAPLTRDHGTLAGLLSFVTTDDNQKGGTDLAAAIEHALSLFDGRTGAHEAVVLLTDGEDLEGKAAALADEAAKKKIRIYVVGIGTEAGGKIPVVGTDGKTGFLRDPDGVEVVTKLERKSLEALALRTGGDYLSAEESPTPLEDLYHARIGRIEGREIEGGERRVPYDRFQWPLALALLCLLAELGLRERGAAPRAERRSPRLAAALLPIFALGGDEPLSFKRSLENAVLHERAGELEAAEGAARAILKEADALSLGELARAKAQYALGVITATRAQHATDEEKARPDWEAASAAFSSARALAGPGELRLASTYDLGALEFFQGEKERAKLPELGGQPPMALPPPQPAAPNAPPGAAVPPPAPPPDPLALARTRYKAAKDWFIERLQAEWRDEDTRANLELIQRRLHELDEIEKNREEQKKQQQDQKDQNKDDKDQKDQKDQKDKDQQGKPQDKDSKDKQDKDKQDKDQKDQKPQDEQDKQDGERKDGDKKDTDKKDQPKPDEKQQEQKPEDQAKDGEKKDAQGGDPKDAKDADERVLTREQVMQLLDKLAELEKQQKAIEAALRAKRRSNVKRDW